MSQPDPEIEPADLEERIYQGLRRACDGDLRRMAKLLASKPYKRPLLLPAEDLCRTPPPSWRRAGTRLT